jgi:hypothetical protein
MDTGAMRQNLVVRLILALALLVPAAPATWAQSPPAFAGDTVLVMVDDRGCVYCVKWDRDVSASYQASEEGRFAPLERRRKGHPDLTGLPGLAYTPTFVLIADGQEVGRIVGYGGEDHFWGELDRLMRRAGFRPGETVPKLSPPLETRTDITSDGSPAAP